MMEVVVGVTLAAGLPRGIPAASLKRRVDAIGRVAEPESSAGNTRGLIEAEGQKERRQVIEKSSAGNTRGLIEAKAGRRCGFRWTGVFRGEYPRPH